MRALIVFLDRLSSFFPLNIAGIELELGYLVFGVGALFVLWGLGRRIVDRRSRLGAANALQKETPYRTPGEAPRDDVDARTGLDPWELASLQDGVAGIERVLVGE